MADRIIIEDFAAPELDIYTRLSEAQLLHYYEPHGGIFLAESEKVIRRALDAGCEPISFLIEKKYMEEVPDLLRSCENVPVFAADYKVLQKLRGFQLTRGILCAMHRPAQRSVAEVCEGTGRIAVLEHVMNPTNVGAIFRSAAALGIDAVLLTPSCADPLYRRAIRVSMGTVFQIPWAYFDTGSCDWSQDGMRLLREMGFVTVAMALREDSCGIDDPRLARAERLAILLGTEGEGLSGETIAACDYTVRIPMAHGVDSLNVAAASAVAFWELRTR